MPTLDTNMFLFCIFAFLLGSVPTGLLLGKLKGKDIRESGSGSIGATNAFRTLGKALGILTFVGDTLKGIPFIYLAETMSYGLPEQCLLGLLAFLGHCYSPYLKFKGGKGVATGLAVFIYLAPEHALVALSAFLTTFLMTGIISISSMLASVVLALSFIPSESKQTLLWLSSAMALIIIIKHRANIQRLLRREENYFNVGLRKILGKKPQ
jgi:glycerol-3-phosphate acyltransferase PlsY